MNLKDKVALITGASLGIGKATAIALAKEGTKIIINYNSNENAAKQVLEECNKHSKGNIIIKADITKDLEVLEMFKKIIKQFKTIDILINNAGIYDNRDSFTNLEAFKNIFNTNLLGHIRVIENAIRIMKKGKIINVTSIHGRLGYGRKDVAAYGAMKAAFDHYTKNLAKELAPEIIVNAIAPGKTLTSMWGDITKQEEKEETKGHLIKRFILPEEVADGILFLLKNDAMCGEVMTIDGGMSLVTLR